VVTHVTRPPAWELHTAPSTARDEQTGGKNERAARTLARGCLALGLSFGFAWAVLVCVVKLFEVLVGEDHSAT